MHTQEQLEQMGDFTLGTIAGDLAGVDFMKRGTVYNPCNNWQDCGELIDECKLLVDGRGAVAAPCDKEEYKFVVKNTNIKRAITIVYILVKQGEG